VQKLWRRAIAHTVIRQPLIADARVRFQFIPHEISGARVGSGTDFSPVSISLTLTVYQRWNFMVLAIDRFFTTSFRPGVVKMFMRNSTRIKVKVKVKNRPWRPRGGIETSLYSLTTTLGGVSGKRHDTLRQINSRKETRYPL